MSKVIAVTNQKGGVGKTVTSVNLGIGLAREGYSVLMIDADPQGSMSISLGCDEPDSLDYSLATALVNIILGKVTRENNPHNYDFDAAYVNDDNVITIADVTALVNIILGK